MNAYAVNLKLKNREALNVMLKTLNDIEIDSDAATANLHSLMSKIASFREISPSEATTLAADKLKLNLEPLLTQAVKYRSNLKIFVKRSSVLAKMPLSFTATQILDLS